MTHGRVKKDLKVAQFEIDLTEVTVSSEVTAQLVNCLKRVAIRDDSLVQFRQVAADTHGTVLLGHDDNV